MKNTTFPSHRLSTTLVVIAILAALLLAACASGDDGVIRLTFDGESCTYQGPTTIKAGPVTLLFINESEERAAVNLVRHTGDETIQDMIDYIGEEPSKGSSPFWVKDLGPWRGIDPGESDTWEEVLEPGIHTIGCGIPKPGLGQDLVWFGGGFTVED